MKTKLTTKDLITAGALAHLFSSAHGVVFSPDHCSNPLSGNAVDCRHHTGNCVYAVCRKGAAHRCDPGAAILVGLITSVATHFIR